MGIWEVITSVVHQAASYFAADFDRVFTVGVGMLHRDGGGHRVSSAGSHMFLLLTLIGCSLWKEMCYLGWR